MTESTTEFSSECVTKKVSSRTRYQNISTKKTLQRLPILITQSNDVNTYENLQNEIR